MGVRSTGKLILASASPRRIELLSLLGLVFDVVPSSIEETYYSHEAPQDYVLRLAEVKARVVASRYPEAWVLAADTIVIIDGEVLGKPKKRDEAEAMLRKLSGRTHEVYTGFNLSSVREGTNVSRYVRSLVTFRNLSDDEIFWYTRTDEPYDKAGAYAVQGKGAFFIKEIQGSYTNVMGLPLCEVVEVMKDKGIIQFC
ncbi:MAG: Maf family protein [Syntrophales bacterium]|nr:Maf family protein [Syntrophales bacterium]